MLAKEASTSTADQLKTDANSLFTAQFKQPEVENLELDLKIYTSGEQQLTLSGSASLETVFIDLVGINSLAFDGSSTVNWGNQGSAGRPRPRQHRLDVEQR